MFEVVSGKITPITKKEVNQFKLLVLEANFLSENKNQKTYSSKFPPELAAALISLGTGITGVGIVFTTFAGMSGAEIMGTLAGLGFGGAVGGIASVAAMVAAPVVLAGGSVLHIANQKTLGSELAELVKQSYTLEKELVNDERDITKNLIKGIQEYRDVLKNKHSALRKITG